MHHHSCKRHEVRWAYQHLGLHSLAPGPHTSKPHPENKIYPYLLNDIEIIKPFSTDITYIRLQHGFVYLMVIIDWYSRFVLDWQLSIYLEADFCVEALRRVLAHSHCNIFNTDWGRSLPVIILLMHLKNIKLRSVWMEKDVGLTIFLLSVYGVR